MLNKKAARQEVWHWGGRVGSGVFLFFKLNLAVMEGKKKEKSTRDSAENQKNQIPRFKICIYRS